MARLLTFACACDGAEVPLGRMAEARTALRNADRTAYRAAGGGVGAGFVFQEWPNRASMARSIRMQEATWPARGWTPGRMGEATNEQNQRGSERGPAPNDARGDHGLHHMPGRRQVRHVRRVFSRAVHAGRGARQGAGGAAGRVCASSGAGSGAAGAAMKTAKAGHTPGPWGYHGDKTRGGDRIVTHEGGEFGREALAQALDFNEYARDVEADANARLIAAAPELLAACKALLARESELTTGYGWEEYRAIEAAVVKAERS